MKSTSLRLEVGEDRRQVLRLLEHRPRGLAQVHAELVGDDVRERRLAEAGRAEQQHVVERLAALPRRADEDLELLARLRLADVLGEALRPQRPLDRFLVRRRRRGADHASRRRGEVVGLDAHGRIIGVARDDFAATRIDSMKLASRPLREPRRSASPRCRRRTAQEFKHRQLDDRPSVCARRPSPASRPAAAT